jgi:hypothetical protein
VSRETAAIVGGLGSAKSVGRQFQAVQRLADAGRLDELVELAGTLEAEGTPAAWQFRSVFDHIERLLALTPTPKSARALLKTARLARVNTLPCPPSRERYLASMLGFAQTAESLLEVLDERQAQPEATELLACWVQEHVVRRGPLDAPAPVATFWEELRQANHPLGAMPLRLLPEEEACRRCLPHYGPQGGSWQSAPGATELASEDGAGGSGLRVVAERRAEDAMTAAVRLWTVESNGRSEARVFDVTPPVAAACLSTGDLLALGLQSLAGAGSADVCLRRVVLAEAVAHLFSAAANGGAYGGKAYGAYGRIAAWQSIAALAGQEADLSLAQLAEAANACAWHSFFANSPWFYGVAWDLGLACIRPGGGTVAVLAATDTD